MRLKLFAFCIAALASTTANAAVQYNLQANTNTNGVVGFISWISEDFLTQDTVISNAQITNCSYTSANGKCSLTSLSFTASIFGGAASGLWLNHGAGGDLYAFAPNAFSTLGTNNSTMIPEHSGRLTVSMVDSGPAVPEPSTWAMMLVGFGAVGFSMRRRRRVSAIAQMA